MLVLLWGVIVLDIVVLGGVIALSGWTAGHSGLMPLWLLFVGTILVQVYAILIAVREYQGLLGPQAAADPSGVYVRTGWGKDPQVVFLPWAYVETMDSTRKGPAVRLFCPAGEVLLDSTKQLSYRTKTARRRFHTAFVVHTRFTHQDTANVLAGLMQTSGRA